MKIIRSDIKKIHQKKERMLIDKNKSKVKTYLTQHNCDNENNSNKNDYSEKLNNFDFNYENLDDFEISVLINKSNFVRNILSLLSQKFLLQ